MASLNKASLREELDALKGRFERLCAEEDVVLVEGAGSGAEIYLRNCEITNMYFAERAEVPVVFVGDLDKGGTMSHLVGTWLLLDPAAGEAGDVLFYRVRHAGGLDVRLSAGVDGTGVRLGFADGDPGSAPPDPIRTSVSSPAPVAAEIATWSINVDFPIPGSPPMRIDDPPTIPPPRTRSTSPSASGSTGSSASPNRRLSLPFGSSNIWVKPATWVGSRVWSVIRVRLSTRNAAARRVVPVPRFQVTPSFGLN